MTFFLRACFLLLGLLLPLHGAITVFLDGPFRFWKEAILVILALIVLWQEIKACKEQFWQSFSIPEWICLWFLAWLNILIWMSDDKTTALIASRYLSLGFVVFFVLSRLLRQQKELFPLYFKDFTRGLVSGSVISTIFGLWAKFGGGFEMMKSFYSSTISSWVPGQTLPLYHQTGPFIRIQGMSSGPGEFSHLLLLGLYFVLFFPAFFNWSRKRLINCCTQYLFIFLFLIGIVQSFSRAAILVALGFLFWKYWTHTERTAKQLWKPILVIIILITGFFGMHDNLRENFFTRLGSSDHITRPVEALQKGFKHPVLGQLGSIGPAARSKNLAENNNDYALISENIFVDIFVQTGFVGLALGLAFWWQLFRHIHRRHFPLLCGMLLLGSIATIFDMTPISLGFFTTLAFLSTLGNSRSHFPDQLKLI